MITLPTPISNGSVASVSFEVNCTPGMVNAAECTLNLQTAIKNGATNQVFYFVLPVSLEALFVQSPPMEISALVAAWKAIDASLEVSVLVNDLPTTNLEVIKTKLGTSNISFVTSKDADGQTISYFSCKTVTNAVFMLELRFKAGMNICKVTVRSPSKPLSELCKQAVAKLVV